MGWLAHNMPQMFNGIHIWGRGRPVHAVDLVLQEVIDDPYPLRSGVVILSGAWSDGSAGGTRGCEM